MTSRVYISGPMTGLPDRNFAAFNAAAQVLRELGLQVVNPAEIHAEMDLSWTKSMRLDIKAMCDCDAIVLLPGWETSKGAHLELHLAHRLEMSVASLDQVRTLVHIGKTDLLALLFQKKGGAT